MDYLLALLDGPEAPPPVADLVVPISLAAGAGGQVDLLPAGAAPTVPYWRAVTRLIQDGLLFDEGGRGLAACLELKTRLEEELFTDFLLIDAPSGFSRLAGLATSGLADHVVCLMLLDAESQEGARAVLRSLQQTPRLPGSKPVQLYPVLSRLSAYSRAEEKALDFLNAPSPDGMSTLKLAKLFRVREFESPFEEGAFARGEESEEDDLRDELDLFRALLAGGKAGPSDELTALGAPSASDPTSLGTPVLPKKH